MQQELQKEMNQKEKPIKRKKHIFPLIGSIINVQAYKYDGTLYRQWNGVKVLRNTKQHYVLLMQRTKVAELNKRNWILSEPWLWFMPKHEMHNAFVFLKKKNNYVYVNLASKPIYEDNTIKFVDFDLDVKNYLKNELTVVDRDEFKENRKKYNYSSKLVNMIYNSLENIFTKYENDEYYYNDEVVNYYIDLAIKDKSISENFRQNAKKNTKFKRPL
ncbi:DUF402 domain-containing protein [Mycoplasmopsis gallinarum]|uniref:DUF402 domain-containing protein n=1 Tax=Mycoplasmopsis gallinarum TaxID=29557 RepID=UPI000A6D5390|nr:DUF402 domain-containing protein [Mycoplasmopsis gallinarum]